MTEATPPTQLRGEAAFRARRAEIAKRNDSAQADGATRRAAREAAVSERQLEAARLERSKLPQQPRP